MKFDIVIRGGVIVTSHGETRASLAVRNGQIAAIGSPDTPLDGHEVVEAEGMHVLPGVIDTHVHIGDPGKIERESWLTGTQAAAAGGITTVLEMPISIPPVYNAEILSERAAHAERSALVDFGLYAGAGVDNLEDIERLASAGAVAFKTFRTAPAKGREQEFFGLSCVDTGQMLQVMQETARTGLLHVVHAEDQQIIDLMTRRLEESGRRDGLAHAESRPEAAEAASVAQCIALAQMTETRLQIAHMSSAFAATLVGQAKETGLQITAETCPHYLSFSEAELAKFGPYAKCNPPLRSDKNREMLWDMLRTGIIDVIGSDHAPSLVEEKEPFVDDIWGALPGMPGLETSLPLLLTGVNQGRLSLTQAVRVMSENPARLFGLWPRKGSLEIGADADVTVVEMYREKTFDHTSFITKSRATAAIYDGVRVQGIPKMTLVRGHVVMRNGRVSTDGGWGKWIKPRYTARA